MSAFVIALSIPLLPIFGAITIGEAAIKARQKGSTLKEELSNILNENDSHLIEKFHSETTIIFRQEIDDFIEELTKLNVSETQLNSIKENLLDLFDEWDKILEIRLIKKDKILLLFIIIVMIYFICSILFESFNQPFTIILMIPVSFIGIFLTFILFEFNFDQGGMASFILLSGITVNSGIYIINDFNKYGKKTVRDFVKAFNYKIFPVSLTILSTILGLIPFVYKAQNDTFWFSFAAGAMGGLIFSYISIFIYLPLFLKMKIR